MGVEKLPTAVSRLVEAAASVAGEPELSAVLRTTVKTAMELTGAGYGALGVLGNHGVLSDFIFEGIGRGDADAIGSPPLGRGVLGAVTDKAMRLTDVSGHHQAVGFPDGHPPMGSFLGVPVRLGEQTYGNLYLTNKAGGEFTEEDEILVEALAVIAGSAVSRARLDRRLERAALVEERARIARDIHDGVIQELFAVGLSLQATKTADPESTRDQIQLAIGSIDSAMGRLRDYIFDLQPSDPDLEARLRTIVAQAATEIDAKIEFSGNCSNLTMAITEHLTQFAREAISNAVRHSGGSTISVRASCDDEIIKLEVEDDGSGFDVEAKMDGMGLSNMRERISSIGGVLELQVKAGAGTLAVATVPLR